MKQMSYFCFKVWLKYRKRSYRKSFEASSLYIASHISPKRGKEMVKKSLIIGRDHFVGNDTGDVILTNPGTCWLVLHVFLPLPQPCAAGSWLGPSWHPRWQVGSRAQWQWPPLCHTAAVPALCPPSPPAEGWQREPVEKLTGHDQM